MSQILVVMPADWIKQDRDALIGTSAITLQGFSEMSDSALPALNETLHNTGYLAPDVCVTELTVINGEIYFQLGAVQE